MPRWAGPSFLRMRSTAALDWRARAGSRGSLRPPPLRPPRRGRGPERRARSRRALPEGKAPSSGPSGRQMGLKRPRARWHGSRRGLVRTFQIARGVPRLSVLENLMLYGHAQPGERLLDAVLGAPGVRRRESELRERAVAVARRLNLTRVLDAAAADLSGGQKK